MEKSQVRIMMKRFSAVEKTTTTSIESILKIQQKETAFRTSLLIELLAALMCVIDQSFKLNQFFITKSDLKIKSIKKNSMILHKIAVFYGQMTS